MKLSCHWVVIYGPHRPWPSHYRKSIWVLNSGDFISPAQREFAAKMIFSTSFVKCHSAFNVSQKCKLIVFVFPSFCSLGILSQHNPSYICFWYPGKGCIYFFFSHTHAHFHTSLTFYGAMLLVYNLDPFSGTVIDYCS